MIVYAPQIIQTKLKANLRDDEGVKLCVMEEFLTVDRKGVCRLELEVDWLELPRKVVLESD